MRGLRPAAPAPHPRPAHPPRQSPGASRARRQRTPRGSGRWTRRPTPSAGTPSAPRRWSASGLLACAGAAAAAVVERRRWRRRRDAVHSDGKACSSEAAVRRAVPSSPCRLPSQTAGQPPALPPHRTCEDAVGRKRARAARAVQVARRPPCRVAQLQLRGLADGAGQVECGRAAGGAAAAGARGAAACGAGGGAADAAATAAWRVGCCLLRRCVYRAQRCPGRQKECESGPEPGHGRISTKAFLPLCKSLRVLPESLPTCGERVE